MVHATFFDFVGGNKPRRDMYISYKYMVCTAGRILPEGLFSHMFLKIEVTFYSDTVKR